MPYFTFTTLTDPSVTGNTATTATVSIAVSPSAGALTATNLLPGSSATGTIAVSNVGDVDVLYFLSADWRAAGTTTATLASLLAHKLVISVEAGSPATTLYAGSLAGLIDQPSPGGRSLAAASAEDVRLTLLLPSGAGNVVQGLDLDIDFIFVAKQAV
ncbi:MAG: hypothetical protein QJR13_00705 [Bacillota bacterium]|nr:hypothetical protein [Bacillota bacterium]